MGEGASRFTSRECRASSVGRPRRRPRVRDRRRRQVCLRPVRRRRETLNAARGRFSAGNPEDPIVEELESEVAELRDLRVLLLEAYDQLEQDVGREVDIALKRQAKPRQPRGEGWRSGLALEAESIVSNHGQGSPTRRRTSRRRRATLRAVRRRRVRPLGGDARPQGAPDAGGGCGSAS